jgi:transcriptional regulator
MYNPRYFAESRIDVMHTLIDAHPLGALVRAGAQGLDADHIPFEILSPTAEAPFGVLRAHVARANPVWREDGAQAMVLFQGPSAYITPDLYEQKLENGKVVPTWDYAVVHAHGKLRAIEDPAWLLAFVERLTNRHESKRAQPWKVSDAPRDYIDAMLKAIVGIEIVVDRLEGKWKISQNRSEADQASVASSLASEDQEELARMIRARLT